MTWKQALLSALKGRSRRNVLRALVVATPAAVIGGFGQRLETGLLLGAWMLVMVYVVDLIDDARKARKAARVSD